MWNNKGFVLITLYLFIPLLLIMAASVVSYALSDLRAAMRIRASTEALFLAEAGIDRAIVQLRDDSDWAAGYDGEPLAAVGTYTVTVEDIGGDRRRIVTEGSSEYLSTAVLRSIEAVVEIEPAGLFRFAMFGDQSVSLNGNANTDSYDSSVAPYSAAAAGSEGDVGTNAISAGSVRLNGNAEVNGNAVVGPDGDTDTAITLTGNSVINGTQSANNEEVEFPEVEIPAGVSNSGTLSVAGNSTRTFAGGTYWWNSVSVSGNGRINFTGPATVYVTGSVSVSGNGIGTATNLPPNLLIFVQGSSNVSVSGNGSFYGAIYAPNSSIAISGNGAFYGAAMGRTVSSNGNGGVHYDLALKNAVSTGGNDVDIVSWQDLS